MSSLLSTRVGMSALEVALADPDVRQLAETLGVTLQDPATQVQLQALLAAELKPSPPQNHRTAAAIRRYLDVAAM